MNKLDKEQLLKVAKMNQKKSEEVAAKTKKQIEEIREAKGEVDKEILRVQDGIQDLENFEREMYERYGDTFGDEGEGELDREKLYSQEKEEEKKSETSRNTRIPVIKSWEELVKEAEMDYPEQITFKDLLTEAEIEAAHRNLDEINYRFREQTKFNHIDTAFLTIAIAAQCVRQYILDPWIKSNRLRAGSNDEKGRKGNANPGWYHAETNKILTNRVPFDCNRNSGIGSVTGFLKGGNHRLMTLGHDPLLGWFFGTANILTNTITRTDLKSAHVKYIVGKGNTIYELANTERIFKACQNRLFNEGIDGKIAVGYALVREAIHLKSDIGTKDSLPIPVIPAISTEWARKLAEYGIDIAGVGTEMSLAIAINTLISMIHGLYRREEDDVKLYQIRTRKIIIYSGLIASTSNVIASAVTPLIAKLDVGGLIVLITNLFQNTVFIEKVRDEFVRSQLALQFEGIQREVDELYSNYFGTTIGN